MKSGPDVAPIASLLGDPARANMLLALMDGGALTAGELARHAGVSAQTASSHLAKLEAGGLVSVRRQGRHRYFGLSAPDVAGVIESLLGLATRIGHARTRPGPRDPALREARVCYDHLAGELGVAMLDGLVASGRMRDRDGDLMLTEAGEGFVGEFGIDLPGLRSTRRPLCRTCLDWSERRSHLAGALGAALLARIEALGWATRLKGSRAVVFTPRGRANLLATFTT